MLDQNITTLLSTLLGGLIAIFGGLVIHRYLQSTANKTNKQKEIRNLIEQIYKLDRDTYYLVKHAIENQFYYEADSKIFTDINYNLYNTEMLIDLYLSPLKVSFSLYNSDLWELIKDESRTVEKLKSISQTFRKSLTALLKKEGYSYF